MIPKKKEDYTFVEGSGRPYEMNFREGEKRDDAERQQPIVINLGDLNGQTYNKGMPKNFIRKAGRVLPSFDKYWTSEDVQEEVNEGFDVE